LTDAAFAGFAEHCRQYMLVNRRRAYDPRRPGHHELFLSYGGSIGHSGIVHVDAEEGELAPDFTGRRWQVSVSVPDVREAKGARGSTKKVVEYAARFLAACEQLAGPERKPVLYTEARDLAKLNGVNAKRAIDFLVKKAKVDVFEEGGCRYLRLR